MSFLARLREKLPAAKPIVREGGTRPIAQAALRGEIAHIRKAVAALPNTSALFATRESYRDVGYAIKAALPDHPEYALILYQDWCARWTDGTNDPDIVEADWRRMKPPFRRGASWLYELAARHGGGGFAWGEQWFQPPEEPLFPVAEAVKGSERKFALVSLADAARMGLQQRVKPLIKGFLDLDAMSVFYGDSNLGKSFVALDIAIHVAAGKAWCGLRATKGRVVYIAAEGGRSIYKRATALVQKYGLVDGFDFVSDSVDLFQPDADVGPLIRDILAGGPAPSFVVVDTLARAMAGGDENSTKDMGVFVRNVDRLRTALAGAHIMLIHHTGKDASRGARGSSALRAATDTEIEITEGTVQVTKQRDLDKTLAFSFKLAVVTLGKDEDGDPITSCTVTAVSERTAAPGAPRTLTAVETTIYAALERAVAATGSGYVSVMDLLESAGPALARFSAETLRTHLRSMLGKGAVRRPKQGMWACAKHADLTRYFEPPDGAMFD